MKTIHNDFLLQRDFSSKQDLVWEQLRKEAEEIIEDEPHLEPLVVKAILGEENFENAVLKRIIQNLKFEDLPEDILHSIYQSALDDSGDWLSKAFRADMIAVMERDPACERLIDSLLFFKGYLAMQAHRLAHIIWHKGQKDTARYLQSRSSRIFQTDIHPAVFCDLGIMLDHATGIVIGETSTIGKDVSILQGVTLGGTGKELEDRHPKIGDCVLIGAGAIILGNIKVENCSQVAAGSVVVKPVPPRVTVAGVPAKIVGDAGCPNPGKSMMHYGLK